MSIPFEIPIINQDVVNGVSYAGSTLTLTRAEGSDLTTTIATSDPTKIENGTSKMEIASANGDCVFTPAGLTAKTTTFAADGTITTNNKLTMNTATAAQDFLAFNAVQSGGGIRALTISSPANIAHGSSPFKINTGNAYDIQTDGVTALSISPTGAATFTKDVVANGVTLSSDDRIKTNEKLIVNATETLSKLTPQIYDKYLNMDLSGSFQVESGLIAQEVYYNAPELRHVVHLGKDTDASGNSYTPTPDEMDLSGVDIGSDPDYGSHGWSKTEHSWLNYQGLIPYLIKSIQELTERLATLENK